LELPTIEYMKGHKKFKNQYFCIATKLKSLDCGTTIFVEACCV
jgi:hypothetical protein